MIKMVVNERLWECLCIVRCRAALNSFLAVDNTPNLLEVR